MPGHTGSHKSLAPSVKQLHRAKTAQSGRLQPLVVAEGRYVNIVGFRNLEDSGLRFRPDFLAV